VWSVFVPGSASLPAALRNFRTAFFWTFCRLAFKLLVHRNYPGCGEATGSGESDTDMQFLETGLARMRRFAIEGQSGLQDRIGSHWTRRLFFLDFLVFPLAIMLGLASAMGNEANVSYLTLVLLFGFGYGGWTLAEYLMHRFVFHHFPVFTAMHLAHHKEPHELIGTPTFVTLAAFALLVFWPTHVFAGLEKASALTAGMMSGYLAYVSVHYIVHNVGSRGLPWMKRLIRLHAIHHHDMHHNFGVTTALWDRVFGTLAQR
jgi:sterol desaturase/sphingolipid hydroxylase (fatty acid hydroxylase superfamily)